MDVVVTARLADEKLQSKLVGLQLSERVEHIYVVRRRPITGNKISNINPSEWVSRSLIFFELWRLWKLCHIALKPSVKWVIGIQFYFHGWAAVTTARLMAKKSAVWLIGSDVMIHSKGAVKGPLFKLWISQATKVLVMGQRMKDELPVSVRDDAVFMQSVIDLDKFTCVSVTEKPKWDLGFIGGLDVVKMVDRYLKIVAECNKQGIILRALILGDGPEKSKLMLLAQELGVEKQVTFAGYQSDVASWISSCRIVVLTSRSEGLPAVLIETRFCGVPIFSVDVGEIKSFFSKDEGVYVYPWSSVKDAVHHLTTFLMKADSLRGANNFTRKNYLKKWNKNGQKLAWESILS